ncbi:ribosomal protein S7e [Artemisia annua]|uniref:40S ribosomal protein S7 n=1 Tax=Artemisia annua TaxID=35608 RepID=A0A2U1LQR8_ARTAN|nr:ribosomal protein S7e [Artemisia annua]
MRRCSQPSHRNHHHGYPYHRGYDVLRGIEPRSGLENLGSEKALLKQPKCSSVRRRVERGIGQGKVETGSGRVLGFKTPREAIQGKALFDLANTHQELKSDLKDLYINSASQIDVPGDKKAVVVYVSYRLSKPFR